MTLRPCRDSVKRYRSLKPSHSGSNYDHLRIHPDQQGPGIRTRRQLLDSGVEPRNIFSDVGISGANGNSTRNQWHALDQKLCQGALLVEEGDSEANAKMRKASDHIGTLIETARQLTGGIGVRCYAG